MNRTFDTFHKRISLSGSVIAAGVVYGDLGTSPLYTLNAVFHHHEVTADVVLGSFSAIFWTLTLLTTVKYIIITLQADNNGEGGIFSLYALIRRYFRKYVVYIAMAGGAFLIADGIITPPISVSSAIEGIKAAFPAVNTVPIVIIILILLFLFQQFGTEKIGSVFGPIMAVWFTFIGIVGMWALLQNPGVLKALNPYYAYNMLVNVPGSFWLLGSIFLCATGAEALYSDMGHCGRNNIRVSWMYIKVMLLLSYAGQTAWLMNHQNESLGALSPFYHSIPQSIYWLSVGLATLATVIASQALISGVFTLINEAIRLNIWPKHLVRYPGKIKGQLYIPSINWFLMAGCIGMVLYFKESTRMEAAFGLSVTLTMLMSTILIAFYLRMKRLPLWMVGVLTISFLLIEGSFLVANLQKIKEGGWITILIGVVLFTVMYIWYAAKKMKLSFTRYINLNKSLPKLKELSEDHEINKYATNLVYLTASSSEQNIETQIVDSIFSNGIPKRADIYWFVHVDITDEPYGQSYEVHTISRNDLYYIRINLGFREQPRIGYYFRQIVNDLADQNEVELMHSKEKKYQKDSIGDIKFIALESFLSYENSLSYKSNFILTNYYSLNKLAVSKAVAFELDENILTVEAYPLLVNPYQSKILKRKV